MVIVTNEADIRWQALIIKAALSYRTLCGLARKSLIIKAGLSYRRVCRLAGNLIHLI